MEGILKVVAAIVTVVSTILGFYPTHPDDVNDVIVIEDNEYALTFYDDFDGTQLDDTKWEHCPERLRQNGTCRWDDSMATLDGEGNLQISASIAEDGMPISGAVRTKDRFEQVGGYFEIRCKLHRAKGVFGGFWLMSKGVVSEENGISDGAEFDIVEAFDVTDGSIDHAIHWDGYGDNHKKVAKVVKVPECFDGEYHTYSFLWTENEYVFYIDGKESYRISLGDEDYPGACEAASYLKISSEFGTWIGEYDKNELPDSIIVDYVKVYTKA